MESSEEDSKPQSKNQHMVDNNNIIEHLRITINSRSRLVGQICDQPSISQTNSKSI